MEVSCINYTSNNSSEAGHRWDSDWDITFRQRNITFWLQISSEQCCHTKGNSRSSLYSCTHKIQTVTGWQRSDPYNRGVALVALLLLLPNICQICILGDLIFTIFLIHSNETNIIAGKQRSSHTLLSEPLIVCVGYARAESYLQELAQSLLIIATTLPWLHSQPHDMMR